MFMRLLWSRTNWTVLTLIARNAFFMKSMLFKARELNYLLFTLQKESAKFAHLKLCEFCCKFVHNEQIKDILPVHIIRNLTDSMLLFLAIYCFLEKCFNFWKAEENNKRSCYEVNKVVKCQAKFDKNSDVILTIPRECIKANEKINMAYEHNDIKY